jgi:hypothetical protein
VPQPYRPRVPYQDPAPEQHQPNRSDRQKRQHPGSRPLSLIDGLARCSGLLQVAAHLGVLLVGQLAPSNGQSGLPAAITVVRDAEAGSNGPVGLREPGHT